MHLLPAQAKLPALTTPRLLLRPMTLGDAADLFDYAKDPEVLRFTTGITPQHVAETEAFLRGVLSAPDGRMWAIRLRDSATVVGAIELGLASPERGSVHFALGKPYWGRGLMTEALGAVCDWAFETVGSLREITTAAVVANVGSIRVLEKSGFEHIDTVEERWEKEQDLVRLAVMRRTRV